MRRLMRLMVWLLGALAGAAAGFVAALAWIGERGQGAMPSTRRANAEAQRIRQPLAERLHGYIYARFLYHYIGWAINGPPKPLAAPLGWLLGRLHFGAGGETGTIADTYHGKVAPLAEATRWVTINQPVALTAPEEVVPFARARDVILQDPDHLVALDCPCRVSRASPCLPLDVCLIVGEPFASFILEHQPNHARAITPAEAVAILEAEDARGHAHHIFFKEAMLDRFYAICNCCTCCCGAMQAHRHGTPMLIASGYVSQVDETACAGCGTCAEFCPFGALELREGLMTVDEAACMGCGVCVGRCPHGALSLRREEAKGVPLEIERLMAQ